MFSLSFQFFCKLFLIIHIFLLINLKRLTEWINYSKWIKVSTLDNGNSRSNSMCIYYCSVHIIFYIHTLSTYYTFFVHITHITSSIITYYTYYTWCSYSLILISIKHNVSLKVSIIVTFGANGNYSCCYGNTAHSPSSDHPEI